MNSENFRIFQGGLIGFAVVIVGLAAGAHHHLEVILRVLSFFFKTDRTKMQLPYDSITYVISLYLYCRAPSLAYALIIVVTRHCPT